MKAETIKNKDIREFTVLAVGLGLILSVIMCAANMYLGLRAGMTVSSAIPASVISMGILRGALRRGTLLENNMVQTIASAGEALAAGAIFTIPALVISGVWKEYHYWPTTLITITGSLMGVLFMIPLRRPLIIEEKTLIYPEGRACAEVLLAGDKGGERVKYVFTGLAAGAVFKFLISGVTALRGVLEGAWRAGRGVAYFGADISPALLGVGYIVGLEIASLVFLGGCIGWVAGIPIYAVLHGGASGAPLEFSWEIWSTQVRYMGVGAMIVGGVWSIISVRHGIAAGLRSAFGGMKSAAMYATRTDRDIPPRALAAMLIVIIVSVFFISKSVTGGAAVAGVSTTVMVVAAFFFTAVSSYIVGLVGSSNNPVSGMTICTVLLCGLLLLVLGMTGTRGMVATLCVAGVVCCAVCAAGDTSQDLKTGAMVGATPSLQQWGQILGLIAAAFVIAPILTMLHHAYGIGTNAPHALKAPQATLFQSIAAALFGHHKLPWNMVAWGAGIGLAVLACDLILKARGASFRTPVMPVAVGIYLPLSLSVPIFAGGLIAHAVKKRGDADRGVLWASGLIAGEAITGIIIGAVIYFKPGVLPVEIKTPAALTVAAAFILMAGLYMVAKGDGSQTVKEKD